MNTFMQKKETVDRKWYVIDAEGQTLGRLATKVATVLKGKHKPTYTPHVDCGDYVGGLRERNAQEMITKYPEEMVERAVKGMLPKGPLGRQMYRKLFVYAGSEYEQVAQKPEVLEVK